MARLDFVVRFLLFCLETGSHTVSQLGLELSMCSPGRCGPMQQCPCLSALPDCWACRLTVSSLRDTDTLNGLSADRVPELCDNSLEGLCS